jgi:hypothetical protein
MKFKEFFSRTSSDSDKFFLFSMIFLASVVIFLLYLIFSWSANLSHPAVLKTLFSWDYIYAFLLWLEIVPLAVLKPALINYLIIISITLIVIGSVLYFLPPKYAFGCYTLQITENTTTGSMQQTCITTQAANIGDNVAIGGYYTLITVVGAIFVDTMRENNKNA